MAKHTNLMQIDILSKAATQARGLAIDAIHAALQRKPLRHEFSSGGEVQVLRFMNVSGG